MIVYMGVGGLGEKLAAEGLTGSDGRVHIVDGRGIITDIRPEQAESVKNDIDRLWPQDGSPADFAGLADGQAEKYYLASAVARDGTWVGKIVPGRLLGFTTAIQILILATVFVSVSLMTFLLMNLRQDKTEIIRSRVKKLQISLFRDWLEHHEDRLLNIGDLENRRDEVKKELRAGLGRLSKHQLEGADKLIDEGWDRIIEILVERRNESGSDLSTAKKIPEQTSPAFDMKQLEEMITRAVAEAKITVPPEALAGLNIPSMQRAEPVPGKKLFVEVEEESDLEDLEELSELGEPEEVEELSDLEDLEELSEPGEPEEVEELSDLEDLEELSEPGEPEEAEELTELETEDDYKDIDADNVEELDSPKVVEYGEDLDNESLEVLPVVLSDDSRELIEIDKIDQDRLYMFDSDFNKSRKNRAESKDSEEQVKNGDGFEELEELEDLEELEEIQEPVKPVEKDESKTAGDVVFFSIEEVLERHKTAALGDLSRQPLKAERTESMESLVWTKTTGILPGSGIEDADFNFDNEVPELVWSPDGLEYDRYLRGFKKGTTGIYKSLMSLSKNYNALCGVLLVGSRKGLESDYALGLLDESANLLSVTRNEPVWSEWFSDRKVVFVRSLSESLYREKTRHNDFHNIRSAVFIPAVYHGSQSYLFLGFKEPPADMISMLVSLESVK
jgi:low affinity Fe/Cu permease